MEAAGRAVTRSALQHDPEIERTAAGIIADVRSRGDLAVLELGRRFDSPELGAIEVTEAEWDSAAHQIDDASRAAVEVAAANISAFHEKQRRESWEADLGGRFTGQTIRPLRRVGVYVPGGTAVYPSSVLMTALPAKVAGVEEIFMCTPCRNDCTIDPLVLYAARLAGAEQVFRIGGAQAIAAMAFGTESVPAVDKIVGPGNVYVNAAKKLLWGQVDIDMLAGPSEVCVLADDSANPAFVAADMLTQAEHDAESAAFLITTSESLAESVQSELERQMERLPRREIIRKALTENGSVIVTETLDQAIELANVCAPEHLALMVRNPRSIVDRIRNAGAILIGDYSPQTLGDYLAGPSHTLPTSGTARFSSPLNVDTFMKKTSLISYSEAALKEAAPHLLRFARAEGFEAHAAAVEARLGGAGS
jgi:histidinol dehydrogenase